METMSIIEDWWPWRAPPTPPSPASDFVVVASGHFHILHKGHVDYLEGAAKLGGQLWVIVNNDEQLAAKTGGKVYVRQEARLAVVSALRCVRRAVLSVEGAGDPSVGKTLRLMRDSLLPLPIKYFANGGDVTHSCREEEVCRELGIELRFGVGGSAKADGSSLIIKRILQSHEG